MGDGHAIDLVQARPGCPAQGIEFSLLLELALYKDAQ